MRRSLKHRGRDNFSAADVSGWLAWIAHVLFGMQTGQSELP